MVGHLVQSLMVTRRHSPNFGFVPLTSALPLTKQREASFLSSVSKLKRSDALSIRTKRTSGLVIDENKKHVLLCRSSGISKWDVLSVTQFDNLITSGSLAVCFVGMSNCGKSHWSWYLHTQLHFDILSVDEEIERNLQRILQAEGHVGIDGLAAWMGFPSDERFAANQATYLSAEEAITGNAKPCVGRNSVLDTTGSVVYLSEATRQRLSQDYLVVHLEASDDLLDVMTENYFRTPKPVVWGDAFNCRRGETADQALRRCYPSLLRERRDRYAAMAHVTIPAAVSLNKYLDLNGFLIELRDRLPVIV